MGSLAELESLSAPRQQHTGGSAMMKARLDVPPYLSWVFPLQTSLQCVKDGSKALFLRLFPPPPLFPSFDWIPRAHSFVFVQDVTQMCSAKTVPAMTGRSGQQVTMSDNCIFSLVAKL